MAEEERVLDGARGGAQAARVAAERLQVVDPLAHREAAAGGIGVDPAHAVQHLPRADVQHAIAVRIEKGQDGGGHGHAHAVQGEEKLGARDEAAPSRRAHAGHEEEGRRILLAGELTPEESGQAHLAWSAQRPPSSSISTKTNSKALALVTSCSTPAGRAYAWPVTRLPVESPSGPVAASCPVVMGTTT